MSNGSTMSEDWNGADGLLSDEPTVELITGPAPATPPRPRP